MIRGSGGSASLSERLRSFSNRYADNTEETGGGKALGGERNKRHEELRSSARTGGSTRDRDRDKYDRDIMDREKDDKVSSWSTSQSASSEKSYVSSHRYVPISERGSSGPAQTQENIVGSRLSSKRDARDAFFSKNEQPMSAPKFDPSMLRDRERDKEREKEKMAYSSSNATSHSSQPPHNLPNIGQSQSAKEIEGYVGFANLPNQVYRKSVKRGFEFTLIVVGESGQGKSTLINSMFLSDLYSAEYPGPSHRIKKTVDVETTQVLLKESGVQLRLTVVDTPGFGDAVDNSNCWQPIINHIENKYDEYLNAESRVNRRTMPDNRVHCCLYFITPNGHGLKPLDVEFMKRLHDKVNIIPLIAKADSLTPDECREFKKTILNEIAQHKIKIYEFPDADDREENKVQKKLKDRVPFAVVGSNTVVESQGQKVRGRMYPWGIVEVENLEHNDFIALRNMLIRTHMQDLKDVTNNVHYENFRYNKLAAVTSGGKNKNSTGNHTCNDLISGSYRPRCMSVPPPLWTNPVAAVDTNPLIMMEEERKEHVAKMKKMEAEMEQVFEMKVKEKKQKLKDSELDLQRRAEQMKKSLEQQQKELEEKRRAFEKERQVWEEQQRVLEEQRRRSLENSKENVKKDKKKSLF